jgi:O-antigen ligase
MTGTFYWYDPFAAFLIAGSVVGLSSWLRGGGSVAALGMTAFTLGSIGLVYSTSRAALTCYALAVAVVVTAHLLIGRLRGVNKTVVALAVAGLATWGIAGPPFFTHRMLPFDGTAIRGSGQSLDQNGTYRIDFWREAVGVFSRHPVSGGGYHSLAAESVGRVPTGWPLSPLAHNGYLQVLSDGGLLLGVPFLLAIAGICWWILSALVSAVRTREFTTVGFALPLSLGALLAHSLVDFDWSYAADLVLVAVLAGAVGGSRALTTGPIRGQWTSRVLAAAVVVGVGLCGVAASVASSGDLRQSLPIAQSVIHGGTQ